jgi:regulator of sigma E protease
MNFNMLAVVFVFGILVLIHELGHFIAAKLMGVRVERFSIGFPPRLFGKKIGDTDYCISAIPLGGYVKMSGMIDESMDGTLTGADYEFSSKPIWKRIIIITAGVVMNFLLAIIILTMVNFINGEEIVPSTEIGYVGKDGIAQKIGFKVGDKILSIQGHPVNTWNDVQERFIENLNDDIRFTVSRDDETLNLYYKKPWFKEKNAEVLDISWMPQAIVGTLQPDSPAEKAGLERGDRIVKINQQPIHDWTEMTKVIRAHPGQEITLTYQRNHQLSAVNLIPQKTEETDSAGVTTTIGRIGIGIYFERKELNFPASFVRGVSGTFSLLALNIKGLWWVISGTKPASQVIGGPIMIAKLAQDAAAAGWERLWSLTAALSAILAFFNILPIPALDGGHLAFLVVEGIIGKPVSTRVKLLVQQIGMAILFVLIIFIFYIDIRRLLF